MTLTEVTTATAQRQDRSEDPADCFVRMLRRWDRRGRIDETVALMAGKLTNWCESIIRQNPAQFPLERHKNDLRQSVKKVFEDDMRTGAPIVEIENNLRALLTISPSGSPE